MHGYMKTGVDETNGFKHIFNNVSQCVYIKLRC